MLREGVVADLANEWDAGETTHVEALASDPGQSIVQAVGVVVNLIGADTASEESVRWSTTFFEQRKVDPLVEFNGKLGLREVLLDF